MQALWAPLAQHLSPLLSLRAESQLRLYAPARVPPPEPAPHEAHHTHPANSDAHAARASADSVEAQAGASAADQAATPGAGVAPATHTVLTEEHLPFFVDLDSWSLGFGRGGSGHVHPLSPDPHLIPEHVLHFVCYVPAEFRQPMAIAVNEQERLGFVTPGWGAVGIVNTQHHQGNSSSSSKTHSKDRCGGLQALAQEAEAAYMGIAVQQFRQLLGLPDRASVSAQHQARTSAAASSQESCNYDSYYADADCADDGVSATAAAAIVPPGAQVVAAWEVDRMMRAQLPRLLRSTAQAVTGLLGLVRSAFTYIEFDALSNVRSVSVHTERVGTAHHLSVVRACIAQGMLITAGDARRVTI